MNEHLRQRAVELFSSCEQVILVTCGPAGPQACKVACQVSDGDLILKVQRTSDHLFNLELQPELAVLAEDWELHGTGYILPDGAVVTLQSWQAAVRVRPTRVHVFDASSLKRIETIDF